MSSPNPVWLTEHQFQPSPARLDEALRMAMREAILTSPDGLWYLLTEVLMHPDRLCNADTTPPGVRGSKIGCCYKKSVFYEPLHREWCRWAIDSTKKRKGILAPRGSFKSTVISFGKAVHAILANPNIRILLVSALEENAARFCGQVKRAFQYNDRMRWLFPEYCVDQGRQFGNSQEFTSPARTDHSLVAPTFSASYIDASFASQHHDLHIIDDPIEKKHVTTEEQAAKSYLAFDALSPLLDPGGELLIAGTRWSHFDLYSIHLPTHYGGAADSSEIDWIVRLALEKPGLPVNQETIEEHFRQGEPIFPTRLTRDYLMGELEKYRRNPALGESFFFSQYFNACRAPGEAPFQMEWFMEIDVGMVPPLFAKCIVTDTALKDDAKHAGGDFTVIAVGGYDAEGRLYILEGIRSNRMRSKEFLDIITSYARLYTTPIVVKQKVSEDTMGTQLSDAFTAARLPLVYKPVTVAGQGRKQIRIKDALQGPMHRREVFFVRRKMPDGTTLPNALLDMAQKELMHLGQYATDDVADCIAMFFNPEVKSRRQQTSGVQAWRVPHAPTQQLGNNQAQLHQKWIAAKSRGAGWPQN